MKKYLNRASKGIKKLSKVASFRYVKVFSIVIVVLGVLYLAKGVFVAAVVNGVPISHYSLVKELEKQGGKDVLDSLVTEKLIYQEARRKNINVSQEEIDKEIAGIETQLKGQGMDLDTALSLQGQTRGDLQKNLEIKLIIEKILSDKLSVTDEEVKNYFDDNQSVYKGETLDSVKDEIVQTLKQQKLSSEYQNWIADIKKNSKLIYFLNF